MNEENMFDDPLIDSLRQLASDIPSETKSRLLYECGMAAAETRMKTQRQKFRTNAFVALLAATGIGFFIGHQFPHANQSSAVATQQPAVEQIETPTPLRKFVRTQDMTTLAAATPINRVFEMLERAENSSSPNTDLPTPVQTQLGTFSFLHELE